MREHGAQAAEELPVLVVGAGFAGVAAAFAARRAGARVRVVSAGAGASELYSGLLDGAPSPAIAEVASALGLVPYRSPRAVATREGLVRTALGRDRAVLDLEALSGRTIAVVDLARDDFDAALLAKSLEASAWARSTRTTFRPVPVAALERGAERRFPPYDFARALENPERVRELATQLSTAGVHADGFLLGPWLGIEQPVAEQLARRLARPVGETASGPGGAAGARFAVRRRELFTRLEIEHLEQRAVAVELSPLRLAREHGEALLARAVVLAIGGATGGGIGLGERGSQRAFRASLAGPFELELDGEVLDAVSSMAGLSFHRAGIGALERVGIRTDALGRAASAVFACGDARGSAPRGVLAALASGVQAGSTAARVGQ